MKKIIFFFTIISITTIAFRPSLKVEENAKLNGVCFVAPRLKVNDDVLNPVVNLSANWLAVVPYGYTRPASAQVHFNSTRQHWGETIEGSKKTIEYAQLKGLKVMLKPHIWVIGQGWAGDFELNSEEDWEIWETGYRNYIVTYAKLAQELNVPLFCIGTEFRKAVIQRNQFWKALIAEVKGLYRGKVTYAANWDNYENITFWGELDYIGIDAYFPLSSEKTPTLSVLINKWKPIKDDLHELSKKYGKQILFTEYGYESKDYTTDGHWKYDKDTLNVNLEGQAIAYKAIFKTFWSEQWFAGGFLWKWHSNNENIGGMSCKRYTPQNKPAINVISDLFKSQNKSD